MASDAHLSLATKGAAVMHNMHTRLQEANKRFEDAVPGKWTALLLSQADLGARSVHFSLVELIGFFGSYDGARFAVKWLKKHGPGMGITCLVIVPLMSRLTRPSSGVVGEDGSRIEVGKRYLIQWDQATSSEMGSAREAEVTEAAIMPLIRRSRSGSGTALTRPRTSSNQEASDLPPLG